MEKVQFQTNIPVEVALKYNDGKEVNGQYGDQVLYTLTDGRVMYVPPIVKKKIDEAGIARGELFTITKAEKKSGTRRTIEWAIQTNGNAQPQAEADRRTSRDATVRAGVARTTGSSRPVNGTPRAAVATVDPKGFLATSHGQFLLQAFAAAVDVAAATERYAASRSLELQFTSEDVREIGLRIFTSGSK